MAARSTPQTFYDDRQAAAALQSSPGFVQGSSDPDVATAQTVQSMCQLIKDSLDDGIVQEAMLDSARFGGRVSVRSIWMWCKLAVKFVHHSKLLNEWLDAGDELQLLIRPDALLRMRKPKGDCAVFTTLVCAMLDCAGVPWEIVTAAVDPRSPDIYSHVYPRAALPSGARLPLDASHGKYAGWEVPAERIYRKQVWDSDGNAIADLDSGYRGLHGVEDMYGLGQDPTDPASSTVLQYPPADSASSATDWAAIDAAIAAGQANNTYITPGITPGYPSTYTPAPVSTNSPNLTPQEVAALTAAGSQLTTIFGNVVGGGSVQVTKNANGTYTYSAPATSSPAALLTGGTAASALSTTSSSSLLLYAGIAVALVFAFSMMGKK